MVGISPYVIYLEKGLNVILMKNLNVRPCVQIDWYLKIGVSRWVFVVCRMLETALKWVSRRELNLGIIFLKSR